MLATIHESSDFALPYGAINPHKYYAIPGFLDGDFQGVRGYTFTTCEVSGPLALRCREGGKVSFEYAGTRPESRMHREFIQKSTTTRRLFD
jgi:hypothetical protein